MNVSTYNFGDYRITDYSGRSFSMFNRKTDSILTITKGHFSKIMEHRSADACKFVEEAVTKGIDVA